MFVLHLFDAGQDFVLGLDQRGTHGLQSVGVAGSFERTDGFLQLLLVIGTARCDAVGERLHGVGGGAHFAAELVQVDESAVAMIAQLAAEGRLNGGPILGKFSPVDLGADAFEVFPKVLRIGCI